MEKVTIVIKSLNEERNIARAIKSAIKALKGFDGEIVLVDSLSTDKTVEIAKKYPIRIIQLMNKNDRSCGVGPQIGYLNSRGDYLYILDGDMELSDKFLKQGVKEIESDKNLAGVAGKVYEMNTKNIIFKKRRERSYYKSNKPKYTSKLMMGGLYKRNAIEKVGYFANPYLHSYEESDLGHRLTSAGYSLKRIPVDMIRHYGYTMSSVKILMKRWKSRYLWGCGELLRYNLGKPTFLKVLSELKIYIAVIVWWVFLLLSSVLYKYFHYPLLFQMALTFLFLLLFLIKKRSIVEFGFSIFSWNITALALICGFLQKRKDINQKIETIVIK